MCFITCLVHMVDVVTLIYIHLSSLLSLSPLWLLSLTSNTLSRTKMTMVDEEISKYRVNSIILCILLYVTSNIPTP